MFFTTGTAKAFRLIKVWPFLEKNLNRTHVCHAFYTYYIHDTAAVASTGGTWQWQCNRLMIRHDVIIASFNGRYASTHFRPLKLTLNFEVIVISVIQY
jgi:hypothetical protein